MDAYPDLSPPMVEIITQWPGHAAEEVERLITVPVELGMNGIPQMTDAALDLPLRPVRRHAHLRGRHRQLLRPPASVQPDGRSQPAERRHAIGVAAVLAVRPDLSLRAAKPRPLADGAQDLRGLDRRAAIPSPSPAWRTIPASAAARCSIRCCSIRPRSPASACRSRRWRARWPPTTAMPAAASIRKAASSITCAASGG